MPISQQFSRSRAFRWGAVAATAAAYCISFPSAVDRFGLVWGALALVPAALTGWLMGPLPGLGAGLLTIPLNAALNILTGHSGWGNIVTNLPGVLITASTGPLAGLLQYQRRRAMASLHQSEQRFRLAFEHSVTGMALVSLDGHWLKVNRALCEMLGYSPSELEGRETGSFSYPEDLPASSAKLKMVATGESEAVSLDKRYVHKRGGIVRAQVEASLIRDGAGQPAYLIAQIEDITRRKEDEARLIHLADHDPLTDLMNRRRFQQALQRLTEAGGSGAVLFLDVDGFKFVNDTLGHQAGDSLLTDLARVLKQQVAAGEMIARMGGDEFAVLTDGASQEQALALGERLRQAVAACQFNLLGHPVQLTASAGVTLFSGTAVPVEQLLARADMAMYRAKQDGRNRVRLYSPDDGERTYISSKLLWEQRIREALESGFTLFAQPLADAQDGGVRHFELLLRMRDHAGGYCSPCEFMDVAERYGLIREIDRWVVHNAISLLAELQARGWGCRLGVNLSGRCFADPELFRLIRSEFARTGADPGGITFEITETAAIEHPAAARAALEDLRSLGCRLAMDDFGRGFLSFETLRLLPVDAIKIDGSLIRGIEDDPVGQQLVAGIVDLARRLGKGIVAEWVETEAVLKILQGCGVDLVQGFFIGEPLPAAEVFGLGEAKPAREPKVS